MSTATPLAGTPCGAAIAAGATGTVACAVPGQNAVGSHNYRIFADNNGDGNLSTGEPVVTVTVTSAGAPYRVSVNPTGGSTAAGTPKTYAATLTDSLGNPRVGDTLSLAASQTGDGASIALSTVAPSVTTAAAPVVGTSTAPATATATVAATDDTGSVTFGVTSNTAGAVNFKAYDDIDGSGTYTAGDPNADAALTVNAGGTEAAANITLQPTGQKAFTGGTVGVVATVTNAQGDLLNGVPVTFNVSGQTTKANAIGGTTNAQGQATLSYTAAATPGTDTIQAFVNKASGSTPGPDAGEPVTTASADLAVAPAPIAVTLNDLSKPVQTSAGASVPVTATVVGGTPAAPLAGYNVSFAVVGAAKFTLSSSTAITDASGKATVNVLNSAPADGDSVSVTATLTASNTSSAPATITYAAAGTGATATLTPANQTLPLGGTANVALKIVDQFNNPVSGVAVTFGVAGRNNPGNNLGATGTATTDGTGTAQFSYTDKNTSTSSGPVDTVSASYTLDGVPGSAFAKVYFIKGTAQAAQLQISTDLGGTFAPTAPYAPSGFTKSADAGTSTTGTSIAGNVQVRDANGDALLGKVVTLTTTGDIQLFSDSAGTQPITDGKISVGSTGQAVYYARSSKAGTATVTATADGVTDKATIAFAGEYVGMSPKRVLDTRTGLGQSTGQTGRLPAGQAQFFNIFGTGVIPSSGVAAVAVNVTAVNPSGPGNLRVYNAFGAVPNTATVNYVKGKAVNNFAVVDVTGGGLDLYSDGSSTDVVIDVVGYYTATAAVFNPVTPSRVVDTRTGAQVPANTVTGFQVGGQGGIPLGAKAVAMNVTAIGATTGGNLRVFPDAGVDTKAPTAANITYIKGTDKGAFVIVQLPASGKIDVYSDGGPINVTFDVVGYLDSTAKSVLQTPTRVLDTRTGSDHVGDVTGPIAANTETAFQVGGNANVPADAQAVLVSVFAVGPTSGNGNLRLYPADAALPTVANVNYLGNNSIGNFAIVKLSSDGKLKVYSDGSATNVVVDVVGWVPAGA